eukprot:symbB.v1.2.031959.t1/scaffold3769.1/size50646/1
MQKWRHVPEFGKPRARSKETKHIPRGCKEECEMLREKGEAVKLVSTEQLMAEADCGDWAFVAYNLARERKTAGEAAVRLRHFQADAVAHQALRRASGVCLAMLPYDL